MRVTSEQQMTDDDAVAQRIVNYTITNYFRDRAIEIERDGKPASEAVSPAERQVFEECRDSAVMRGVAGSLAGSVPTALLFRFATKLQRVNVAAVSSVALMCGFYGALSNTRACMVKFLALPEKESEVAAKCREALKAETPDAVLWKEVQKQMKSGSVIRTDFSWKREDAKANTNANVDERKPSSNEPASSGILTTREAVGDTTETSVLVNLTREEYWENAEQQPAKNNNAGWIEENGEDIEHWKDGQTEWQDEPTEQQNRQDHHRRQLRVDEQYDLLYQGDFGENRQSNTGTDVAETKQTTWEEIRQKRQQQHF
jgi:hypothetical protein